MSQLVNADFRILSDAFRGNSIVPNAPHLIWGAKYNRALKLISAGLLTEGPKFPQPRAVTVFLTDAGKAALAEMQQAALKKREAANGL